LVDDDGTVLLGDLGVAVSLNDEDPPLAKSTVASTSVSPGPTARTESGMRKRKSFVGTVGVVDSCPLVYNKNAHSRAGWLQK
jgi:hypothetical protein